MRTSASIDRRRFLVSATAGAAASALAGPGAFTDPALAQRTSDGLWRELNRISAEAVQLGLAAPRMTVGVEMERDADYLQIMPATVALIDGVKSSAADSTAPKARVNEIVEQSQDLLIRVNRMERNLPTDRGPGLSIQAVSGRPQFESIKDEYAKLFNSCSVRSQYDSQVRWYLSKLEDKTYRRQWYEVAKEACCPWYFVSIIHGLEGSFNFGAHLHNGDPLSRKTTSVPAGRPDKWNPPNDWVSSAVDAVRFDGFADQNDWSLERTLFRWEAYNGFRSRRNGINTPYLWSFSNHYSKGKFVADNVWDPNAVSKQCGAAVMLKALIEKGLATPPA